MSLGPRSFDGTIAARNPLGELVFLQKYTIEDFQILESEAGNEDYGGVSCVIIPPPPDYLTVIPPDIPAHGPSAINMTIENPADIDLVVYVNDKRAGEVKAGEDIAISAPVEGGITQ
jgi:hypothetical protein